MCAVLIDIRCNEFSVVVTDTSFVDTTADRSFNMHFSFHLGIDYSQTGYVTINAKILLSLLKRSDKSLCGSVPLHPFWSGSALPCGIGHSPIFYAQTAPRYLSRLSLLTSILPLTPCPHLMHFTLSCLTSILTVCSVKPGTSAAHSFTVSISGSAGLLTVIVVGSSSTGIIFSSNEVTAVISSFFCLIVNRSHLPFMFLSDDHICLCHVESLPFLKTINDCSLHKAVAKRTDDNHVHLSIIIYSTFVCAVPYIR